MIVTESQEKKTTMHRNFKAFILAFVVFAVLFTAVMVLLATGVFQENVQRATQLATTEASV